MATDQPLLQTKEDLEKEKLQLEIGELRRPWFKKKEYLQILLPTIVAVFSLAYAIVSGFFSTKYEQYELKKEQLKLEVDNFQSKKDELIKSNETLSKANETLSVINKNLGSSLKLDRNSISQLQIDLRNEQNQITIKEQELSILKSKKYFYDTLISNLQFDYNNKKKILEGEITKQYRSQSDLLRKMEEQKNEIDNLKNHSEALNYQIKKFEENPFIPKNKRYEFLIWINDEMLKYYEKDIKKNEGLIKSTNDHLKYFQKQADSLDAEIKVKRLTK